MAEEKPESTGTPKDETKEDAKDESSKDEDAAAQKAPKKKAKKGEKQEGGDEEKPKGGKKKLIIIIAAAAVVILLVGGGAAFFLLSGSGGEEKKAKLNLLPPPGPVTTYTFPKILADLKTGLCEANYLSMRFMVEVGKNYTKALKTHQLKLLESVQLHLRSLERKDLVGKVGADELRVDITTIINNKIKPGKIEGVIFKEFFLQ